MVGFAQKRFFVRKVPSSKNFSILLYQFITFWKELWDENKGKIFLVHFDLLLGQKLAKKSKNSFLGLNFEIVSYSRKVAIFFGPENPSF